MLGSKGKTVSAVMPPKNPHREKRLAAALRENLKRRKAASRARLRPTEANGVPEDVKAAQDRPNNAQKPD